MHIKSITAKKFRRFTELEITNIPATARLVVLAGPNGNGKSSLFDAFLRYQDRFIGHGDWDQANLIEGTSTLRLIDRDGMSDQEVKDHESRGYRVLRRRQLESYLFDDEILEALCDRVGGATFKPQVLKAKVDAIAEAVKNGHDPDDVKKARGRITEAVKKILSLKNAGKSSAAFMRDTLTPLVTSDTKVYNELRAAIFG